MPKQSATGKPTTPDQQRAAARSPDSYGPVTTGSQTALHPDAAKVRENEYAKAIQALRGNDPKIANVAKCLRELDEARPYEAAEFFVLQCDLYKRAYSVVQQTANAAGQRIKLQRVLDMHRGKAAPADVDLEQLANQIDTIQRSITIATKKASLCGYWSTFCAGLRSEQPRLFEGWEPEHGVQVPDDSDAITTLHDDLAERWHEFANFWTTRDIPTEYRDGWLFTAYRRPTEQAKRRIKIVNTQK